MYPYDPDYWRRQAGKSTAGARSLASLTGARSANMAPHVKQGLDDLFQQIYRLRPDDIRNLPQRERFELFGGAHPDEVQTALFHDAVEMADELFRSANRVGNGVPTAFWGRNKNEVDYEDEYNDGYDDYNEDDPHLAEQDEPQLRTAVTPEDDEVTAYYVPGTGDGAQSGLSAEEVCQLIHQMYSRDS